MISKSFLTFTKISLESKAHRILAITKKQNNQASQPLRTLVPQKNEFPSTHISFR